LQQSRRLLRLRRVSHEYTIVTLAYASRAGEKQRFCIGVEKQKKRKKKGKVSIRFCLLLYDLNADGVYFIIRSLACAGGPSLLLKSQLNQLYTINLNLKHFPSQSMIDSFHKHIMSFNFFFFFSDIDEFICISLPFLTRTAFFFLFLFYLSFIFPVLVFFLFSNLLRYPFTPFSLATGNLCVIHQRACFLLAFHPEK